MTTIVELRPAYVWDCENCGRENFHRGLVPELSKEEIDKLKEDQNIDPLEEGIFVMMPKQVKCKYCNIEFETKGFIII